MDDKAHNNAAREEAIKDILEEDDLIWDESFLEDDVVFKELDKIKEDNNEIN